MRFWIDAAPPFNRPPQVIKLIEDLVVDEDTDKLDFLKLYDYFRDTDVGDACSSGRSRSSRASC